MTYLDIVNGIKKQLIAIAAYTGVANQIIATDGDGLLSEDLLPAGVGADTFIANASENLTVGPVNIWDDSGTVKVRKADGSTTGKACNGWVKGSVTSGDPATVYRGDITITGLSGLTQGAVHYLGTTAGTLNTTAPSADGQTRQELGLAVSTTVLLARIDDPIEIDIA